MKISKRLIAELKNKEYRDAFVSEHIDTGIPFQVRALREQRGLTQKELAERAGMKQERISAIENPNNKNAFTLSTLKRLASAFDIALIVRFSPISQLVDWELKLSHESLQAVSFSEDPYFRETEEAAKQECNTASSQPEPSIFSFVGSGGFRLGGEGKLDVFYPSQAPSSDLPQALSPQPAKTNLYNLGERRQKTPGIMEKLQEDMKMSTKTAMAGAR
ncbi:MAG: helix-turn-helix transcriptional regulator [Deltaproteobacteria bacterium]|nr:helix-turn-helix transcriptional regulator [Deltaproteobacteria bacterium]